MSSQFIRSAALIVSPGVRSGNNPSAFQPAGGDGIDLSSLRFTFKTVQQDVESPNNCSIRVYNPSPATVRKILGEYTRVTLQAGYGKHPGIIFDGTVIQFRTGRESPTTTYLDILAADGDIPYNQAFVSTTLAARSRPEDRVASALSAKVKLGATQGYLMPFTGGILPRGKVLFGMARAVIRSEAQNQGASWNINNGAINVVPLDGYLPGEAVVLNAGTGLIGMPEQTNEGMRCKCLLNPRIEVGGLVQIDNKLVNQTLQAAQGFAPIQYNQYSVVHLATITADGLYRVYVAEHEGDSRGQAWYTSLICLAVDNSTKKVQAP